MADKILAKTFETKYNKGVKKTIRKYRIDLNEWK